MVKNENYIYFVLSFFTGWTCWMHNRCAILIALFHEGIFPNFLERITKKGARTLAISYTRANTK